MQKNRYTNFQTASHLQQLALIYILIKSNKNLKRINIDVLDI